MKLRLSSLADFNHNYISDKILLYAHREAQIHVQGSTQSCASSLNILSTALGQRINALGRLKSEIALTGCVIIYQYLLIICENLESFDSE